MGQRTAMFVCVKKCAIKFRSVVVLVDKPLARLSIIDGQHTSVTSLIASSPWY